MAATTACGHNNTLLTQGGTGQVSLLSDELKMCGLVDDDDKSRTGIQLLVQIHEPGGWHIRVLDEDAVDATWSPPPPSACEGQ